MVDIYEDENLECTDGGSPDASPCSHDVEYRQAPSGSSIPRCSTHNNARWDVYENSDLERAANSPLPPSWFDPTACGEQWEDD